MVNQHAAIPAAARATALLGAALCQHRIQRTPEQRARVQPLAEMARALGAISDADWQLVRGCLQ